MLQIINRCKIGNYIRVKERLYKYRYGYRYKHFF